MPASDFTQLNRRHISAYGMLILAPLFWAGNYVVGKAFAPELPPATLVFLRWLIASIIFLPFVYAELRTSIQDISKNWFWLTRQAFLGIAVFTGLIYTALHTTTAVNTGIIMAMTPVFIPLLLVVLGRASFSVRIMIGVLISFMGIAYMISRGSLMQIVEAGLVEGDLVALMAMFSWALYSIFVKDRPAALSANVVLFSTMLLSCVMVFPVMIFEMQAGHFIVVSAATLLAIAYIGICPSLLSFFLFNRGTEIVGASRGALFMHLLPIWAVVLSVLFLGESIAFYHAIGLLLVGVGMFFVLRQRHAHNG